MSAVVPTRPTTAAPAVRKPRRWRRRLVVLAVFVAVCVWFAPVIIANTGLRNRAAREALADLKGSVEIGGASLGWFAPVELRDVVVKDEQGRTLLTVAKITSSKNLVAFLRDRSDLGEFTIERPDVQIVCENGATNLEQAIAKFLKSDGPPSPARPAVALRVLGGAVALHDAASGQDSRFESVEASVGIPRSKAEPISVRVAAATPSASPATVEADLSLGDRASAKLVAKGFPLESLAPILKRVDPGMSLAGKLTADLTARWEAPEGGRPTAAIEGAASLRDLDLAGPWLAGDRLRIASADLPVKLQVVGNAVSIEQAELKCDIGTISAVGSFDPDEPLERLLDKPGAKFEADVDLAKLAALFPRLLHVREGTALRDGKLTVKLASRAAMGGTVWDGEIRTTALRAERGGKPLEWPEPLAVEFTARAPAGKLPSFDKFICRSDFLAVNAQGSPESFRAAANVYLDRLAARLGEFVELGQLRLSGEASLWVIASGSAEGAFKADAGAELKRLVFTDGTRRGLNEPAITLRLASAGKWPRVESGSLTVVAGADTVEVKLLEPIPDARQAAGGGLSAKLSGDLARWITRTRGFVRIPQHYVFGGATTATGIVRLSSDGFAVDQLVLGVQQARFRGAGVDLDEPRLDASANLTLNRSTGAVEFAALRITCPTIALTEGKLTIESPPDGNTAVSGNGHATTDLNRLGRTLKLQSDPKGSDALHGRGTGPIRFRWQGDTTTFGGTLDVKDFAYGDPKQSGISEPSLKLDVDGKYEETHDRLTLARARAERPGLAVDAKGSLAKIGTTQDTAFDGTLTYDLAKLTPEIRNALGGNFQATGQGSKPFALKGSLAPGAGTRTRFGAKPNPLATLAADAALGWDSVKAYGFDMGPGELKVNLAGGTATVSPIRASFGGGQVAITPTARLAPEPEELTFAKGKVIDRAKLTPAVCAGALGYALPVIANAAQAGGEISAILDDNRIPLGDYTKTTLKGQLVIHKATVSPGPVVAEIMKLLGTTTTMTLASEMTVPVRVESGRVYHENLSMTVNGYMVKTSGSAGFDGSLALVAEVPIPGSLPGLKNNPVLKKALEGKIVKVPIGGTMAKPALDPRQFQAAIADLTKDAMKGAGKELFNREIEKLFPGLPVPKK